MPSPATGSVPAAATSLVVATAGVVPVEATGPRARDLSHPAVTVTVLVVHVKPLVDVAVPCATRATLNKATYMFSGTLY